MANRFCVLRLLPIFLGCILGMTGPLSADPTELTAPPAFKSPICHYLDRGFDDHVPGLTDRYSITPHGPRNLADLRHIQLGLDLPTSYCESQSHAVPCADHDDPQQWCVRRVALSVLGFELFDASEPTGCLLRPRAGTGGLRTLTSSELRNHPQWGLTEQELTSLISGFDPSTGAARIPAIRFSAGYLSRQIEGLVGEQLARYVKGCANKLYCGNRRGRLLGGDLLPFWADSEDVDCDLGSCPGVPQRRSSPWVEIRGQPENRLRVDIDIDVNRGKADLGDHAKLGTKVLPYYGTTYKEVSRGSLSLDLGFKCERFAQTEEGKLPLCSESSGVVCFQPGFQLGTITGKVVCPDGEQHAQCGETVPYDRSHELRVDVGDIEYESESGGLIEALIQTGCFLFGLKGEAESCHPDDLGTYFVQQELETSALGILVQDGLDSCPDIEVDHDGSVEIDFSSSGGLSFETAGFAPPQDPQNGFEADLSLAANQVEKIDRENARQPDPDRRLDQRTRRPGARREAEIVPARRLARLARLTGEQAAGAAGDEKIPMAQLDAALRLLCALAKTCPGLDFSTLPIEELSKLDLSDLENLPLPEVLALLDPLLQDAKFRKCVGGDSDPIEEAELLVWLLTEFQPALDGGQCASLQVESLLPLVGLELKIETAGSPVGDTFAFVDFGFWRQSLQDAYGCLGKLIYPPSNAPLCENGTITKGPEDSIGQACGTIPGGPCHDLRTSHPEWQRGYPEDAAFHPNGDFRWYTRCGHDSDSGLPMVCNADYYNGAGINLAGTCKLCGEPGQDDDPFLFTTIGCTPPEPDIDEPCPPGQFLGLNGRCWDFDSGVPEWECEADCGRLLGKNYGWCVHHGPWRSWMEGAHPYFDNNPSSYQQPICAEHTSCTESGVPCAAVGKMCQPDTETCEFECVEHSDCQAVIPAPAYPEGFLCQPQSLTCLP